MCGTRSAASRVTAPGSSPSPFVMTPCSSPYSKRICIPTQIPRTGHPAATRAAMTGPGSGGAEYVDVQGDPGRVAERLPDVAGHRRRVHRADVRRERRLVVYDVRPAGQVDGRLYEYLVERDQRGPVPPDALLVPQGF